MKLYQDFKQIIDKIDESRKNIFWEGLSTLVSNTQHSQQKDKPLFQSFQNTNLDISSKNEGTYSYVEHLVTQAREPMDVYGEARDRSEKAYRNFVLAGLLSLLVIFPLISNESILLFIYLIVGFAIIWAVLSWIDFNKSIKDLVRLRDACR